MIYLIQLLLLAFVQISMRYLYTNPMARFQEPIVKGMIDYWPPVGNPYTEPFHKFGWRLAFCFGFLIVLVHASVISACTIAGLCSWWKLFTCICSVALCIFIHWKNFDEDMGKALHNYKYFIGGTSWIDKELKKKYGQDAGEKKDTLVRKGIYGTYIMYIILNVLVK